MNSQLSRTRHWSRTVALSFAAIGAVLLAIAATVGGLSWIALVSLFGSVLAVAGLIIGVLASKLEKFETGLLVDLTGLENGLLRDLTGLVRDVGLAKQFGALGLAEVWKDSTTYDYSQVMTSRRLVVVLNDGRTWTSVHRDKLRRRFADPSKHTVIFLIHPASPMVDVLARKASKDSETIKARIKDTVELLQEIREPSTSLEVLGHHLFNPQSLVLADDCALITPYFLSRGGRAVPVLRYEDTGGECFFKDLEKDVELLRLDAQDITSLVTGEKAAALRLIQPGGTERKTSH